MTISPEIRMLARALLPPVIAAAVASVEGCKAQSRLIGGAGAIVVAAEQARLAALKRLAALIEGEQ